MSETTRWKHFKRKSLYKTINCKYYELRETEPGGGLWYAMAMPDKVQVYTLANAKRAAHRHAEGMK